MGRGVEKNMSEIPTNLEETLTILANESEFINLIVEDNTTFKDRLASIFIEIGIKSYEAGIQFAIDDLKERLSAFEKEESFTPIFDPPASEKTGETVEGGTNTDTEKTTTGGSADISSISGRPAIHTEESEGSGGDQSPEEGEEQEIQGK